MNKVLSDERLGAKLRVTENRCVLFNSLTYVYMYVCIYIYIYRCMCVGVCVCVCVFLSFSTNAKRQPGVPFLILLRIMLFGALTSRDS